MGNGDEFESYWNRLIYSDDDEEPTVEGDDDTGLKANLQLEGKPGPTLAQRQAREEAARKAREKAAIRVQEQGVAAMGDAYALPELGTSDPEGPVLEPGIEQLEPEKPVAPEVRKKMGPSGRVASMLTDDDLFELATQDKFPEDLKIPEDTDKAWLHSRQLGGKRAVGAAPQLMPVPVPLEQIYSEMPSKYDRFIFLKKRRDEVRNQRLDEVFQRELKPLLLTAGAAGLATASTGVLVLSATRLAPFFATMTRNDIANWAVDAGVDSAFNLGLIYAGYRFAKSATEDKHEQLEKDIEDLKSGKNIEGSESPPIAEAKDSG